jgi:hypothetical protein
LRFKAIDSRIIVEAAMNAPRRPTLPQWKIDLVKAAMTFIEGETGGPVAATTIGKRIPSMSMADIHIAMKYLEAERRLARAHSSKPK